MALPRAASAALEYFDGALKLLASALVVVLLGTVTAGVVFRSINQPLSWTDEISGFLMVWLACLGWMIATRNQTHIRIRLLQNRLPGAPWRGTEVAIQLAVAIMGGLIAWQSIHLVQVNADIEAVSLPLSTAWMYAPLLPAGLVTMLQAIGDMFATRSAEDGAGPVSP